MTRAILTAALLLFLGAASAWAATINGTPRGDRIRGTAHNDILRGLAGNDKLYGLAGNDKLYGGPGDDLLDGGPGVDLLNCGPGRDTAIVTKGDMTIGCEIVKGYRPPPTTSTATTTTTTARPPMPQAGHYCGFTNNGGSICFDIIGTPLAFTNAQYSVTYDSGDCSPPATGTVPYTTGGSATLKADGSFDFEIAAGDSAGTYIKGVVDGAGGSSGTLHIHSLLQSGGTGFTCALDATWSAKKQ